MSAVTPFLGGPHRNGEDWTFTFGEHLSSNWGAVYGGALAACTVAVARDALPALSPRSLHLQIVRSVPIGPARAVTRIRHAGRTVTTLEVTVQDPRGKPAVVALLTLIEPTAVAGGHHDTTVSPFAKEYFAKAPGAWAPSVTQALEMADTGFVVVGVPPAIDGSAPVGLELTPPWTEVDVTGPEVACLAADAAVASPLVEMFGYDGPLGPNTDLTLRFTTAPATPRVAAVSTLTAISAGTTTVAIEVQAEDQSLGRGLATSLLLDRGLRTA